MRSQISLTHALNYYIPLASRLCREQSSTSLNTLAVLTRPKTSPVVASHFRPSALSSSTAPQSPDALPSPQRTTSSVSYLMLPGRALKISSTHTILPPGEPAPPGRGEESLLESHSLLPTGLNPHRGTRPGLLDDDRDSTFRKPDSRSHSPRGCRGAGRRISEQSGEERRACEERARSQAQGHREQRQGAKLSARLGSSSSQVRAVGALLTLRPAETEAMETVLICLHHGHSTQLLVCQRTES